MAKSKKRRRGRAADSRRQAEEERLADERTKKQWDPVGRALVWGDLVFLAASILLERNGLITGQAAGLCTIVSVVLLLIALWLLFGNRKGGGAEAGPRL